MGRAAMRGKACSSVLWRQGTWSLFFIGTLAMFLVNAPVAWTCGGESCYTDTHTDDACVRARDALIIQRDILEGQLRTIKNTARRRWGTDVPDTLRKNAQKLANDWGGWGTIDPGRLRDKAQANENKANALMKLVSEKKTQLRSFEEEIQEHLKKAADFDAQAQSACTGS